MRRLFSFPHPVNETSARLVAGGVVLQVLLFLVVRSGWLLIPLSYPEIEEEEGTDSKDGGEESNDDDDEVQASQGSKAGVRTAAVNLGEAAMLMAVGVNPIGSLQPCKSFPWLSCVFDCVCWLPFAVVCVFPLVL